MNVAFLQVELETKPHRSPKEMKTDYHAGGKYPWRHAFRRHLADNPHLWTEPVGDDVLDVKADVHVKINGEDVKIDVDEVKIEPMDVDSERVLPETDISDSVEDVSEKRTIDRLVTDNLNRVIRKRTWSGCTDSSYDSDDSLQPVEKEFEKFINKVNRKWWVHTNTRSMYFIYHCTAVM